MLLTDRIFVAGHRGLVGSALVRKLKGDGYRYIITRTHGELDLLNQNSVASFFSDEEPDYVFLAAAKVGGIQANARYRADFLYQNLAIQLNVMESARQCGVKRLLFLGSSCVYPRLCPQPIREEYLLQGPFEPTNEPYAIAKVAGIKLCEAYHAQYGSDFIAVMPTNLYGPHDHFNLENSHVLPALIRKAHEAMITNAKQLNVWGTGEPKREFLHVDDMASACVLVMNQLDDHLLVNIGSGHEVSIKQLAEIICDIVGFKGDIVFDSSMPDGAPRKLLDATILAQLGWRANISLEEGIRSTYQWYLQHENEHVGSTREQLA